jgi:hypothetical protein
MFLWLASSLSLLCLTSSFWKARSIKKFKNQWIFLLLVLSFNIIYRHLCDLLNMGPEWEAPRVWQSLTSKSAVLALHHPALSVPSLSTKTTDIRNKEACFCKHQKLRGLSLDVIAFGVVHGLYFQFICLCHWMCSSLGPWNFMSDYSETKELKTKTMKTLFHSTYNENIPQ